MSRQHSLVGLQVLELRKAKHCFAQLAACEANESKELSSGLAKSCAEMCSGFREGKLKRRKHEMLQLSPHPLHQYCCSRIKECMTAPNVPIKFWMLILPRQSRRISHTQRQSSSAFDFEASSMPNGLGSSWVDVCTWLAPDSLPGGFGACPAAGLAAANVINDRSLTFL